MQISFGLCLPRDEASVPVVRHICRDALAKLGIEDGCVSDVELAVTEACTNVLVHTENTGDVYEVNVEVDEGNCTISVTDGGSGFDHENAGRSASPVGSESGRGIFLMRSMVDDLRFVSVPNDGTIVKLRKNLVLKENSILGLLASRGDQASASS